jgi:hypothetical protein
MDALIFVKPNCPEATKLSSQASSSYGKSLNAGSISGEPSDKTEIIATYWVGAMVRVPIEFELVAIVTHCDSASVGDKSPRFMPQL